MKKKYVSKQKMNIRKLLESAFQISGGSEATVVSAAIMQKFFQLYEQQLVQVPINHPVKIQLIKLNRMIMKYSLLAISELDRIHIEGSQSFISTFVKLLKNKLKDYRGKVSNTDYLVAKYMYKDPKQYVQSIITMHGNDVQIDGMELYEYLLKILASDDRALKILAFNIFDSLVSDKNTFLNIIGSVTQSFGDYEVVKPFKQLLNLKSKASLIEGSIIDGVKRIIVNWYRTVFRGDESAAPQTFMDYVFFALVTFIFIRAGKFVFRKVVWPLISIPLGYIKKGIKKILSFLGIMKSEDQDISSIYSSLNNIYLYSLVLYSLE